MAFKWGMQDRHYVSKEYKKEVLEHMSIHQLIDTILINPTVHVSPSYRDTGLSASYTFKPLSNLVYTRDQQANPLALSQSPRPSFAVLAALKYTCTWAAVGQATLLMMGGRLPGASRTCLIWCGLPCRSRRAEGWCRGACAVSSASWRWS